MLRRLLLCCCSWTALASADGPAEGEQLFRDARALFDAGAIAEACLAFDASYRADPNLSTLIHLALCRERNGQLATAWAHYVAAANQTAGRNERARMHARAAAAAASLEERLSHLIINVPDASRIDGLVVTRDGKVVDPASWNRALPIDGGTYVIAGKAPGHEAWSTTVRIDAERDRESVDVPRFHALPEPTAPATATTTEAEAEDDATEDEPVGTASGSSFRRPLAIGLASVGVGAGIAALLLDVSARDRHAASRGEVDDERQRALHDSAVTRRYGAQALAVVGVGALVTGVVLFVIDHRDRRRASVHASLTPAGIGIVWAGGF